MYFDKAKLIFLQHRDLATVDTSKGPVTDELATNMSENMGAFYGVTGTLITCVPISLNLGLYKRHPSCSNLPLYYLSLHRELTCLVYCSGISRQLTRAEQEVLGQQIA